MAECLYCEQMMTTAASCTMVELHADGEPVTLIPHRAPRRRGAR